VAKYYIRFGAQHFRYIHKREFRQMLREALTDFAKHGYWPYKDEGMTKTGGAAEPETHDPTITTLSAMSRVSLSECTVVGHYLRFDKHSRDELITWRERIEKALKVHSAVHENFLIWAAPGSGKTFFVEQIAKSLRDEVDFQVINLAKDPIGALDRLNDLPTKKTPTLCLLDEIDTPMDETDTPSPAIPYKKVFPFLDMNLTSNSSVVFVLVGSKPGGREEMLNSILGKDKGPDLLRRVPEFKRFDIPAASLEDFAVILISHVFHHADSLSYRLHRVQKASLYYALATKAYSNPSQLRDLAVSAVERIDRSGKREYLLYDDLFEPKDLAKYDFASEQFNAARPLWEQYVEIDG